MSIPQTMTEITTRIRQSIERVVDTIAPLSPAQLLEPRLGNGRSVKDMLAHLAWWDQWLLYTLPPASGETAASAPPLVEEIPNTEHWADEMNAKTAAYNQTRELAPVQAEFTETYTKLLQRVSQLSLDDLYDPSGMSAEIGQPVAPLVLGIYEHYEEHAHELEQVRW